MKKRFISIILATIPFASWGQNHVGNFWISGGKLNVEYSSQGQMTSTQIDNSSGAFGAQGIVGLDGGDMHLRGYWGVVIDKNGGNLGESGSYSNGVLPAGGSFAVRTRVSSSNFRTDLIIRNNGNIGIGLTNPSEKLVIDGNLKLNQPSGKIYWDWTSRVIEQYSSDGGTSQMIRFRNSMGTGQGNPNGGFDFSDHQGNSILRINDFKVGIGTANPDSKLTVAGDIHSKEVRVSINAGSDFVFQDNYDLRTLSEVEQFINENKHLPDIEPAKTMEEKGIELGRMDMRLLQKIEELTLYMIDFKKQIDKLNDENRKLRDEIAKLKKD
jgi:hypothetical protein